MAFSGLSGVTNRGHRLKGCCRVYQRNTLDYIHRAVRSWQAIFERDVVVPFGVMPTCEELARVVKRFLSSEVSSSPREQLAFQSIKKGLPASCRCMESKMIDRLVSSLSLPPSKGPSQDYLRFVVKQVLSLFPKGWDKNYEGYCLTTTPPLKGCVENPRSKGGSLGAIVNSDQQLVNGVPRFTKGQAQFLDATLRGELSTLEVDGRLQGEVLVVQSAGKPRPLTKFMASSLVLKPLHKTIYRRLKDFPWLLSGPPTAERLKKAGFREGAGELVSGDYASATDGLFIEVAEAALGAMAENSVFVPKTVSDFALRALRPLLTYTTSPDPLNEVSVLLGFDVKQFEAARGQMMGSYLSFPMLCLQNYLAFRWSLRGTPWAKRKIPLLINGDDILFQLDGHFNKWSAVLGDVGLVVEVSKTSVENDWGTINSTLLQWEDGLLVPAWAPRFGMFRPADCPNSLGTSFLDFLKGCQEPAIRYRSGLEWFKWHVAELRSAGVSLPTLGFRGLLARRLAQKFEMLHLPEAELPRAFKEHDVGFSEDFVSRVDLSALTIEEKFHSSCEVAAQKWNRGFRAVDRVREAILYCIDRTAVKAYPYDYPAVDPAWFLCSHAEFQFRLRNCRLSRARATPSKAFLSPFPAKGDVLFVTSVLTDLSYGNEEFGVLPAYQEFPDVVVGGGAPWW